MRVCFLVAAVLVLVVALSPRAHAQDPLRDATRKEYVPDVAEQLVTQSQGWFETLGAQGNVPRLFTGITHDAKQFIVDLDDLTFDQVKLRDFIVWLCQKYRVIAYAYATRVMRQTGPDGTPREHLDIYASSREKDVAASFAIVRDHDGSIKYQKHVFFSEAARAHRDEIFLGLQRADNTVNTAPNTEFETEWAALEPTIVWQSVKRAAGALDPDDPRSLVAQALQLYSSGNCEASLVAGEKAADLLRKQHAAQSAEFAQALVAQALCHRRLVHVVEAEHLYRQAIAIYENVVGPNSPDVGIALDNLAALYSDHGRLTEAEQLRLRALEIFKSTLDPTNPHIATALQNLAVLYGYQGRLREALAKYLEALPLIEKAYGSESREVGVICDNLAGLYRINRNFDQAELFYVRALSIFQKTLGREHPDTALALQNFAVLLSETGRSEEAERMLKEALSINERLYGATHDTIAAALNTLVLHYMQRKQWSDALAPARRAAEISLQLTSHDGVIAPSEGGQRSSAFRRLVQAAYGSGSQDSGLMNEAYIAAQRALDTQAALALSQLAARYAAGDGALAGLLRERQDLVQEMHDRDKLLIAAVAMAPDERDRAGEDRLKLRIAEIGGRIEEIDQRLNRQFPAFTQLSKPTPISIPDTQALLSADEALLLYLDLQAVGDIPETGFAWLVTREAAEWVQLPIGTDALARSVATLRCGLDAQRWEDKNGSLCRALLQRDIASQDWLPFDLNVAFELYQTLMAPFEAKIKNKHLLIVPSGALGTLPPSVLVTEKPVDALPANLKAYSDTAWLGVRHPITILPSVGSLKSLRQFARKSAATKPYLGIGNPLLDGPDASFGSRADSARLKQSCDQSREPRLANSVAASRPLQQRGGLAAIADIRAQIPLPETADELCAVARDLGLPDSDVWLGARATEHALKRASADGELATYRIVHFATHGALAGELMTGAEPGLILTPPAEATREDDGYLSASEIAALKLDADWVILSACNTAAGGAPGAEALSGMARAFFYAGARSLLVSHWAVDSDSTVRLIAKALDIMTADKSISRSDALRRAMLAMIQAGDLRAAHPANWAPFVVVGEGNETTRMTSASIAPAPPPHAPAKARRQSKKAVAKDWRKEIWR